MTNVTPMLAAFVKSNYPMAYANWDNVSPSCKQDIVMSYTRGLANKIDMIIAQPKGRK